MEPFDVRTHLLSLILSISTLISTLMSMLILLFKCVVYHRSFYLSACMMSINYIMLSILSIPNVKVQLAHTPKGVEARK
jgi:hypothetical protein